VWEASPIVQNPMFWRIHRLENGQLLSSNGEKSYQQASSW